MENNTLGSRLGTRYPEPSNPIESLASWLKSLAPQTAAVQPEPKKTASPSAVEASRLSRFVDDIKARLGEEPPTGELAAVPGRTEIPQRQAPRPERAFDDEFPAGAEAPTGAFPAGRVGANMAEHYRGGSGQAPAMVASGPTFDQAFPANPSWPANAGPQPPRAAPTRRAPSAGALGGSAPAAQAPTMPPAPAPVAAATPVVASDAPAEAKRKSLLEMYKELVKDLPKEANGDLTPQQKSRMQMDFFMNLLARSSKPGAYALGAAGEAGLDTSKAATDQENKNYDRSRNANNDARGEAMRMLGLEDKDQDNVRADRTQATQDKRWAAAEVRDQKRLDIEMKKLENEGKKPIGHQVLSNGNIGIILADGSVKDSGAKAKGREPTAQETAFAMITGQGGMSPQDAIDRLFPAKPKIVTEDYFDPTVLDAMGQPTRRRVALDANTGQPIRQNNAPVGDGKPDPVANKGRTITGPDGKFKSDGKSWVKV